MTSAATSPVSGITLRGIRPALRLLRRASGDLPAPIVRGDIGERIERGRLSHPHHAARPLGLSTALLR